VQPKYLQRRLSRLKSHLDRIIICVPDDVEARKVSALYPGIEILVAGLEIGYTGIRVSRELVRKLNEVRKNDETLEDVIERLLLMAKKNQS
jgi:hypothetical protein